MLCSVRALDGKLVNGYRTLNSVGVSLEDKSIQLLQTSPYSTEDAQYKKTKDLKAGQVLQGDEYHLKSLWFDHVQAIDKQIKLVNSACTIVDVLDREFDDKAVFDFLGEQGHLFVIRGKVNRNSKEYVVDEKGKKKLIKLSKQFFLQGFERHYSRIKFKKKVYHQAKGVFEYAPVELEGKTLSKR